MAKIVAKISIYVALWLGHFAMDSRVVMGDECCSRTGKSQQSGGLGAKGIYMSTGQFTHSF